MVEQLWEQEDNTLEMAYTKIIRSYGEDVSQLSSGLFVCLLRHMVAAKIWCQNNPAVQNLW